MNDELIEFLANFTHDPFGWVLAAFPWGEPGELENDTGPESWQEEILCAVRDKLITTQQAIRMAVTSGHGVGKSALVSWLILWAMSTFPDTVGVVTANTETQLKTKTWVQLAKWYRLSICKSLFHLTATCLYSVDPEHEKTWRLDMIPWSERNTEAFAGLHNKGKRILIVFDEASAIPDLIWEVTEGALTDTGTEILWMVFGNPTKNKGRFFECWGKFAHRWSTMRVDSRLVRFTDKTQIQEWIDDWGEDSDFVRVRVRGVFPRVDADSFIPYELAKQAVARVALPDKGNPVLLGCDISRFGTDATVLYPRCGADGVTRPIEVYYGLDTMTTASKIAAAFLRLHATMAFVDEGGVGGGVVDRLRMLQIPVYGVDFGSGPDGDVNDGTKYSNKRAEIWGRMREWLKTGSIPERVHGVEVSLVDELTAPTYGHNARDEIQLESKKDMRRRGVASPNIADALACTFAFYINLPDYVKENAPVTKIEDYNPYDRIYA